MTEIQNFAFYSMPQPIEHHEKLCFTEILHHFLWQSK